ncbi:MAG: penicillin-binding protein [Actinobacteria bacterium]|nr:MAG: penicillin-binding protein [Actinomycetota bacterium]
MMTAVAQVAPLVRTGLLGGIAVAVLLYPVASLAGLAVKSGAEAVDSLPRQLLIAPSPQTTYVYAADGKTLLTTFYEEDRKYIPISQMSPLVRNAIVAAEDSRFFEHHGVDLKGTVRAFVANQQAGGVSQGASTLTMQYVRNVLRDAADNPQDAVDATAQDSARKLREMRLAIALEKRMSKTQILEGYLNVAYFGHRAYGIFAASNVYFSKPPDQLTLDEAAMVAGLVQAPSDYDPAGPDRSAALDRRNYVIDRMAALGDISPAQAAAAKAAPVALHLSELPNDCVSVPAAHNDWGFFCDIFRQWWMRQPAFGTSPAARWDNLRRGGYTVVTSLDPDVQASAMRHATDNERIGNRFALGAVFVEPGTGRVRAAAVNRVYSLDQSHNPGNTDPAKRAAGIPGNYPNTVNMLLGGGPSIGYQAGSTFKLFTMLTALEQGYGLNTSFYAPRRYTSRYYTGPRDPQACAGGHWCPRNASRGMTGTQTMWSGFGKSVNTYWVQVEQKVGAQNAVAMAQRLGLTWHTDIDRLQASPAKARTWGAFTLGVADTTPLEMADAYATIAADGRYCEPLPVRSITRSDGQPVLGPNGQPVAAPRCSQVVSRDVARAAVDAARCPTGYGAAGGGCGSWSTAPSAYPTVGRPFAGKTGTTDDARSVWFIGFTPQLAGCAFVADPDNPLDLAGESQYRKPIATISLTMRDAMRGLPVLGFTPPPAGMLGRPRHGRAHD